MKHVLWLASVMLAISVTGCNNSSNNNHSSVAVVGAATNAVATKNADADPLVIDDASALQQDLNAVFGNADSEPVDIQPGESLTDLLGRINP
ncbi:MAG: Unknown protein [uncultured Thiotrichaceae bacterium]|uniref:Uncharacterized protein n=1 Tax=uncultured Thiotrichaceae bacterium TaxID=298394 RepID=A0A6S6U3E2_9GAMM|nr:MAG: Unknown protein [uncultured Thiotrichaceae bacterium]